jgi:hypothetical protein
MYARSVPLREDEEAGPIGPSPLKSGISKIKNVVSKVQASPAYKIGMGAWSGGLVGAAKAAGMHVPSALAKPGEFLTRPEISTAIAATAPEAGSASTAARGIWGAATRGIGSPLARALGSTRFVPELNPVASEELSPTARFASARPRWRSRSNAPL